MEQKSVYISKKNDPTPKQMVSDLKSKTGSANAAKKIYDIYRVAFENFEALLLSKADLKYVYPMKFISESESFSEDGIHGESVEWSIDSSDFVAFKPELPSSRRINPMYKSDQLISVSKWKKLQMAADNFEFLEDELLELYRIRNVDSLRKIRNDLVHGNKMDTEVEVSDVIERFSCILLQSTIINIQY